MIVPPPTDCPGAASGDRRQAWSRPPRPTGPGCIADARRRDRAGWITILSTDPDKRKRGRGAPRLDARGDQAAAAARPARRSSRRPPKLCAAEEWLARI